MYAELSNVPSWHEDTDGQGSAGVLEAHTVNCGATLLFWAEGWCVWPFRTACVLEMCAGSKQWRHVEKEKCHGSLRQCDTCRMQACNSMHASCCRHLHTICICLCSMCWRKRLSFSPSLSLSLLPGCSIIYRQNKSRLAQQGAYQLTTYSYRAVKMSRIYMMHKRDTLTCKFLHLSTECNCSKNTCA